MAFPLNDVLSALRHLVYLVLHGFSSPGIQLMDLTWTVFYLLRTLNGGCISLWQSLVPSFCYLG